MKKDNENPRFPEDPEDDDFLNDDEEEWFDEFEDDHNEEDCPIIGAVLGAMLSSKPFGLTWDDENISKFLKQRGYKILTRHDEENDRDYKVAVKPGESKISSDGFSNLRDIFDRELQEIILNWLIKISKN